MAALSSESRQVPELLCLALTHDEEVDLVGSKSNRSGSDLVVNT